MTNISTKKILLLITFISFAVLVATVFWHNINFSFFVRLLWDDANEFARSGFISSDFMPLGYTSFLGLCIKLAGIVAIPAFQAIVYAATLFLALWFLKLRRAEGAILILGVLAVAFHPVFLLNNWRIHDGNLTVFLLLGFLASSFSYLWSRNVWSTLLLGLFMGLLFTVRVNTVLLVFPALMLFYNQEGGSKFKYLRKALLFLVVTAVVFVAANLSVKGRSLFLPQHGFYNLFSGANEYSREYLLKDFSGENSHQEALEKRGFSSVDTIEKRLAFPAETYKNLAIDYIKKHPIDYVKLTGIKIFTLFRPGYHATEDFSWISIEGVKKLIKTVLALPFFLWIFLIYRDRKEFFEQGNIFVFLIVVLYLLPFFIANADPRYRFPIDLILILDSVCRLKRLPFFGKG